MDEMEHFHFLFAFIDHLLYVSRILVAKHTINKTSPCPQGAYSQCIKIIIWMRVVTAKKKKTWTWNYGSREKERLSQTGRDRRVLGRNNTYSLKGD